MTHLRKLMLDELQRRNYAQNTVRSYIHAIEDFAKVLPPFARSPRPKTYSRVPGSPVSRLQALTGDDRRSYSRSAFSLRQDTQATVSSRSHSVSRSVRGECPRY